MYSLCCNRWRVSAENSHISESESKSVGGKRRLEMWSGGGCDADVLGKCNSLMRMWMCSGGCGHCVRGHFDAFPAFRHCITITIIIVVVVVMAAGYCEKRTCSKSTHPAVFCRSNRQHFHSYCITQSVLQVANNVAQQRFKIFRKCCTYK